MLHSDMAPVLLFFSNLFLFSDIWTCTRVVNGVKPRCRFKINSLNELIHPKQDTKLMANLANNFVSKTITQTNTITVITSLDIADACLVQQARTQTEKKKNRFEVHKILESSWFYGANQIYALCQRKSFIHWPSITNLIMCIYANFFTETLRHLMPLPLVSDLLLVIYYCWNKNLYKFYNTK